MRTPFLQSLVDVRAEYESELSEFTSSWKEARWRISRVFADAPEALDGATVEHENGDSSTLYWRNAHIAFKVNEKSRRIVRSLSTGDPDERDELYDPASLTDEKIEREVKDFVRSVLGLKKRAAGVVRMS